VIAELDGVRDGARLQMQPALLRNPHHHGAVRLEHEHGAIVQALIARQRDRDLSAALRRCPEAMPGNIGNGHGQEVDGAVMFEFVKLRRKRRIKTASENLLDPQH
jgi:hypothetical protein